jgi:MFS family permease
LKTSTSRKPFVLLQASSLFDAISGSMLFLLFPWIALEVTGSSAASGLVVTLTGIPGLLLAPVMGSIIDRFGRRRTTFFVQYSAGLAICLLPAFALFAPVNLFILIVLGLIKALVSSGGPSARKSLVPDVAAVANMTLPRANGIHEAIFAVGFATGPAIAAVLIPLIGSVNAFWVSAAFAALSGLAAQLIRVTEKRDDHEEESGNIFVYAVQGFKTLFATPAVLIMMSTFLFLAVVYLPTEMIVLPRYFNEIGQPEGLGAIISIMAFASMVGALSFEKLNKKFSFAAIFRMAILGVALSMIPMSMLPPQWVLLAFGVVLGLAWGPLGPLLNTVIQEKIPANKRGRVFALEMAIWSGGPMISMTLVGGLLDVFGVQAIYITLALMVTAAAITAASSKQLRALNQVSN